MSDGSVLRAQDWKWASKRGQGVTKGHGEVRLTLISRPSLTLLCRHKGHWKNPVASLSKRRCWPLAVGTKTSGAWYEYQWPVASSGTRLHGLQNLFIAR